jgi:hypothetical protein
MYHARYSRWISAVCGPCVRLKAAVLFCAFFGGCGTYLHDDALQKRTDSVVAAYKAADVTDAVASTVAAQAALGASTVQDVISRENAARDALLAPLMLAQPDGRTPIAVLDRYISDRVLALTGNAAIAGKVDVLAQFGYLQSATTRLATQQTILSNAAATYTKAGGMGATSCPFTAPAGLTGELGQDAGRLAVQCQIVQDTAAAAKQASDALEDFEGGEIGAAQKRAAAFNAQASAATADEASQSAALDAKTKAVVAAASAAGAASSPTVTEALKHLADALQVADEAAGAFGLKSPGTALANVKFRKTNLCNVIAAEAGKSCTGGTPDPAASEVTAALGNLSAGLAGINEPPDAGVTSVALAYQSAVGNVVQTQLTLIRQEEAMCLDERDHLLQELGYLQLAHTQLMAAQNASPAPGATCLKAGFGRALTDRTTGCSAQYQQSIAQALVAVNQSFSSGLTVARVDLVKLANLQFGEELQVTQQVSNARASVIGIVIN